MFYLHVARKPKVRVEEGILVKEDLLYEISYICEQKLFGCHLVFVMPAFIVYTLYPS
jgi:hypothetical protein